MPCQCRYCRLERNSEHLATLRVPMYVLDGAAEEKLTAVAVKLPTFGRVK